MVRRIVVFVVLLFTVGALGAMPARAGGPTSVLLSAPPSVIAFGYEDKGYGELQELIQTDTGTATGGDHASGRFVRAAWLVHDQRVWRLDTIYPDAPGGPWIATEEYLGRDGAAGTTWHRPSDPQRLVQLLGSLKLLNGEGGPVSGSNEPAPTQEPAASTAPAQVATSTSVFTGWRWIIPGALLGAAAVLALRLFPKRRWELIG
ncbi:hypothetical protein [Kribbella sp. NPDC048915]|uniref:hypothetical protein n=1 Tax=Kribbella sp. NPDC048915 TaxID=3155148 RepID=UPI0033C016B9